MGVLAQADHETIEGETISADMFSPQELNWPWLPPRVEKRIAQSVERTRRIIEVYEAHVHPDWPTLIFATSVEHAKTVAALLTRKGIRGHVPSVERRRRPCAAEWLKSSGPVRSERS